jgi:hypothetical protein
MIESKEEKAKRRERNTTLTLLSLHSSQEALAKTKKNKTKIFTKEAEYSPLYI